MSILPKSISTVVLDAFTDEVAYTNAMKIDDATMKGFLDMGETEPYSVRKNLDQEIKRNYQLKFAMQQPKEYIGNRMKLLRGIRDAVNEEYASLFKRYRDQNKLTLKECKKLAEKGTQDLLARELQILEAQYPSEFSTKSYNAEIQKQIAQNFIDNIK